MKYFWIVVLVLLAFLAISSGAAKIMLMPHEVEFFGRYGFTPPLLIAFGAVQLIGGIMLPFQKARAAGSALIAATFLASLILLVLDGNIVMAMITAVFTGLAVAVVVRSRETA